LTVSHGKPAEHPNASDFLLKVTRWGAVDSASVAQWTVQRRDGHHWPKLIELIEVGGGPMSTL